MGQSYPPTPQLLRRELLSPGNQYFSVSRVQIGKGSGGGRSRGPALALVALLWFACKAGVWDEWEHLEGQTVLNPGEPVALRIRMAMANDQDVDGWSVDLHMIELFASEDDSAVEEIQVVRVTGQVVVGATGDTCEEVWGDSDTGTALMNDCYVPAGCPNGASSCEAVVEFQMLSTSDTPVTVEWVVYANVSGPLGCRGDPDEVDASLEVEALD